ncbi:MAG: hypothetical protein OHK0015_49350 [Chloroflexi bacterium OHK40]
MRPPVLLELALRRSANGVYAASLELRRVGSPPAQLVSDPLPLVRIDGKALLTRATDPEAYGAQLAAMVFADEALRAGMERALAAATSDGATVHLRLRLPADDGPLNALAWETLAAPTRAGLSLPMGRLLLARAPDSPDLSPLPARPDDGLRLALAVASPSDLGVYGLPPVQVDGLVGRVAAAGQLQLRTLGRPIGAAPATPEALRASFYAAPDILVLICHGTLVDGRPWLWLEGHDGCTRRVSGEALASDLAALPERPALVVLASCASAGDGNADAAMAAVGPLLARAGVVAVVAMRGPVTAQGMASFVPALVSALAEDGRIDRAVAVARSVLSDGAERWAPALFARVADGQLWQAPTPPPVDQTPTRELHNRALMLARVREFWVSGVLDWAFNLVPRIELRLATRPASVASALEELVARSTHPTGPPPDPPGIGAAYDASGGALLVLGEPGSGKTFQMIELARRLLERAEADPREPIPMVVNLATWASRRQRLGEWLLDELQLRYNVPRAVGHGWISEERVALLLDGLDEVPRSIRTACVKTINSFRAHHQRTPIVICCRTADYAELRARLALSGAVEVQPLTRDQIDSSLQWEAAALPALGEALAHDEALLSLAESPLMLNVMRLVFEDASARLPAAADVAQRREQLLRAYVDRALRPTARRRPLEPERARRWLRWLARGLIAHSQTTFYLEQLQPGWLGSRRKHWLYAACVGLMGGILVTLLSTTVLAICFGADFGLIYGPLYGLCFGVSGALKLGLDQRAAQIESAERLVWSWSHFRQALREALRWFPQAALVFGTLMALVFYIRLRGILLGALIFGAGGAVLFGLSVALFFGIAGALVPIQQVGVHAVPGEGIKRAARNMWLIGLPAGLVLGIGGGLLFGGVGDLAFLILGWLQAQTGVPIISDGRGPAGSMPWLETRAGVALVAIGGLILTTLRYGGDTVGKHLALRWVLALGDKLPWRVERFLDECEERVLMRRIGGGYAFIHRLILEHFANSTAGREPPGEVPPQPLRSR